MAASWIPRASTAVGITAAAALGLAVAVGASVSSGPLVVAGYGMGFQPLPRGEQGAVTRDADISITAAVPVRDMRIAFRARGLDVARTVTITFDGEPVRTVRLPADSNVPVVIVRRAPTTPGGHVVRLSASGPERPARPFIIVGGLSAEAAEDSP